MRNPQPVHRTLCTSPVPSHLRGLPCPPHPSTGYLRARPKSMIFTKWPVVLTHRMFSG